MHTVYVPADRLTPAVPADWGAWALAALDEHAPTAAALAQATALDESLVGRVLPDVRAKLEREPVEDLRVDFEDGYGSRPPEQEDADALAAAQALAGALTTPAAPLHAGPRIKGPGGRDPPPRAADPGPVPRRPADRDRASRRVRGHLPR